MPSPQRLILTILVIHCCWTASNAKSLSGNQSCLSAFYALPGVSSSKIIGGQALLSADKDNKNARSFCRRKGFATAGQVRIRKLSSLRGGLASFNIITSKTCRSGSCSAYVGIECVPDKAKPCSTDSFGNVGRRNIGINNFGVANTGSGNIGIGNAGESNIGAKNSGKANIGFSQTGANHNGRTLLSAANTIVVGTSGYPVPFLSSPNPQSRLDLYPPPPPAPSSNECPPCECSSMPPLDPCEGDNCPPDLPPNPPPLPVDATPASPPMPHHYAPPGAPSCSDSCFSYDSDSESCSLSACSDPCSDCMSDDDDYLCIQPYGVKRFSNLLNCESAGECNLSPCMRCASGEFACISVAS